MIATAISQIDGGLLPGIGENLEFLVLGGLPHHLTQEVFPARSVLTLATVLGTAKSQVWKYDQDG